MSQLGLFDNPASARIARRADPLSSKLAAEEITESGLRDAQKSQVLYHLRACAEPVTSMELAHKGQLDRYVVARRLPDLEKDGLVIKVAMRSCGVSGRQAITWRIAR